MKPLRHEYYVYVIEARDRAGRPVLYVGQSGKTPEERLREHKTCKRYCRGCRCRHYAPHAARLRHELFARYNPIIDDRKHAERIERWLADRLRKRGYRVIGGH